MEEWEVGLGGGNLLLKQIPWRIHPRLWTNSLAPPALTFLVLLFHDDLDRGATSSLGFEVPGDELQGGTENGGCGGSRWLPAHRFPRALVL